MALNLYQVVDKFMKYLDLKDEESSEVKRNIEKDFKDH